MVFNHVESDVPNSTSTPSKTSDPDLKEYAHSEDSLGDMSSTPVSGPSSERLDDTVPDSGDDAPELGVSQSIDGGSLSTVTECCKTQKELSFDNTSSTGTCSTNEDCSDDSNNGDDEHSQVQQIIVSNLLDQCDTKSQAFNTEFSETTDDDDDDDSDIEDDLDDKINTAKDNDQESVVSLLERAHERIAMQHLHDDIARLQDTIDHKNDEIEHLSGQLRRAVETKNALLSAHTELERHHEQNISRKELDIVFLKKEKIVLEEQKSVTERELLGELVKLTDELKDSKMRHQREMEDCERLHRNELLEKDLVIAQLEEEVRRLKGGDTTESKKKLNEVKIAFV